MLPVGARFPGVLADGRAVDEAKTVGAANGNADLICLRVAGLGGGDSDKAGPGEQCRILSAESGFGAFGTLKVLSVITEQASIKVVKAEIEFEWDVEDEQIVNAGLVVDEAVVRATGISAVEHAWRSADAVGRALTDEDAPEVRRGAGGRTVHTVTGVIVKRGSEFD